MEGFAMMRARVRTGNVTLTLTMSRETARQFETMIQQNLNSDTYRPYSEIEALRTVSDALATSLY